jgi:hypothetical protein
VFVFVPSSLLILFHLSCLFVSLSLSQVLHVCSASVLSSVNRRTEEWEEERIKSTFLWGAFCQKKAQHSGAKGYVLPSLPPPVPPISPLKKFPQFTHRAR